MAQNEKKSAPDMEAKKDEIKVKNRTPIRAYLAYIASLFESKQDQVVIRGTGYAIRKANALAALSRYRFKGLHQLTEISTIEMPSRIPTRRYKEEEDKNETEKEKEKEKNNGPRKVALVTITLSKKELDKTNPGYLPPLPDSEVTEYVPFVRRRTPQFQGPMRRGRGRGWRGGFGGYRSRGRGYQSYW